MKETRNEVVNNDPTRRQAAIILAGHPRELSAEDRLIADDARGYAWKLKRQAMFERLVVRELREELGRCRIKR